MDQQMSNRIRKSHRFSQVPCAQTQTQGLFLLIPAPASQSKLIIPPALTCSGANGSRSSSTTWRNYTRMRSSTSSRSWPAWRRRSPTSHTREPETFRCVSGFRPHVRNEPKVTPSDLFSYSGGFYLRCHCPVLKLVISDIKPVLQINWQEEPIKKNKKLSSMNIFSLPERQSFFLF